MNQEVSREDPLFAESISRFGNSASIALFDPACQLFSHEKVQGMMGYRIECGCAVVFGNPICPYEQIPSLIEAFSQSLETKKIIYLIASDTFASWFMQHKSGSLIEFGEELIVDPLNDPTQGADARKLRNKLSHATRDGVTAHEYLGDDPALKSEIEQVNHSWLKGRKGAQIYLAHTNLFANRTGRRWFYAKMGERIVGTVLLNQLDSREGWLLNLKMTTPDAPHGTSELMVISILEALRKENCRFLSFGVVPLDELGRLENFGKTSTWFARNAYKIAMKTFDLGGLKTFWKKFQPKSEPLYILFNNRRISLREIRAVIRSVNGSL